MRAVSRHHASPIGLIVFDTHLNLSECMDGDRLTRASPMLRISELDHLDPRRIAIIGARGPRNLPEWTPPLPRTRYFLSSRGADRGQGGEAVTEEARAIAARDGAQLYVSVDIDGVDPAFAPRTNSPEPGGLTAREIIRGVRIAARDGFAGFDLVEVSPDFDSRSGTTSVLAARLVEALCCLAALRERGARTPGATLMAANWAWCVGPETPWTTLLAAGRRRHLGGKGQGMIWTTT